MKQKIGKILIYLITIVLVGEEAHEHYFAPADPAAIPAAYSQPPQVDLPSVEPLGNGPALTDELADNEHSVPRYWLAQITYEITDNAIGSDAVPGGQQYRYLYTFPSRIPVFQHEKPTPGDIRYVPHAIRDLGMAGMVKVIHVHSIPIR